MAVTELRKASSKPTASLKTKTAKSSHQPRNDKAISMKNIVADEWFWSREKANDAIECKFIINDEFRSPSDNVRVSAGEHFPHIPTF